MPGEEHWMVVAGHTPLDRIESATFTVERYSQCPADRDGNIRTPFVVSRAYAKTLIPPLSIPKNHSACGSLRISAAQFDDLRQDISRRLSSLEIAAGCFELACSVLRFVQCRRLQNARR